MRRLFEELIIQNSKQKTYLAKKSNDEILQIRRLSDDYQRRLLAKTFSEGLAKNSKGVYTNFHCFAIYHNISIIIFLSPSLTRNPELLLL